MTMPVHDSLANHPAHKHHVAHSIPRLSPLTTLQTRAILASTKGMPNSTLPRGLARAPRPRRTGSTKPSASVVTVTLTLRNSGTAQMWKSRSVSNSKFNQSNRYLKVVLRSIESAGSCLVVL